MGTVKKWLLKLILNIQGSALPEEAIKDLVENKIFCITFLTMCQQLEESYELDIEPHMKARKAPSL